MLDDAARPWRLSGGVRLYKAVGCLECRHTGYRGRAGLYELLVMSPAARKAIHPGLDSEALRRQAIKDGQRPLRLGGVIKVAEGLTTPLAAEGRALLDALTEPGRAGVRAHACSQGPACASARSPQRGARASSFCTSASSERKRLCSEAILPFRAPTLTKTSSSAGADSAPA